MQYKVTLNYTEYVKGEPRDFAYESRYEAADIADACRRATNNFEHLARNTWVGWNRTIRSLEAKPE